MSEISKNKKIIPAQSQEIEQKEKRIKEISKDFSDQDTYIPERDLLKEFEVLTRGSKKLTPEQRNKQKELIEKIAMLYGLENGVWAGNLSYKKYYNALGQMRKSVVKDYNCQTSLEFMLADRIVGSYWRSMRYDRTLNFLIENDDGRFSFDQLKVNVIKELNRGLEFANRQLNTNIILLKELKQPKLNVKVNTENAFIAQNQQINVDKPNVQENENIETK